MTTITRRLAEVVARDPGRVAIVLQDARQADLPITRERLARGAAHAAGRLRSAGVRPGDVVVIILQHGEALIDAFWGAALLGAVPAIMPFLTEKLSPDKYRRDLAALIGVTRPGAIVSYPEFEPEIGAAIDAAQPGKPPQVVVLDAPGEREPEFDRLGGLEREPDDIALLQHSSGSTGLQKGVALSHRALFNQIEAYARAIRLAHDDVIVSWLPLYHDMGLIASFVLPVLTGTTLVLMSPFDWVRAPARLLQSVSRYHGTLCWLPNFAYNFCAQKVRERDLEGVRLDSLRAVINCSEPMYEASHRMFVERFGAYGLRPGALATCYAMAENVFAVSQGGIDGPVPVDQGRPSAGRPLPNVEVRVLSHPAVDRDEASNGEAGNRSSVPEGSLGEIAIRSDCMLTEYFNRPDATVAAFYGDFYLTGDLGYLKAGELYVTGRIKDLIIVGGKNVYPQDIEQIVTTVPGVHPGRVVAFGVANPAAGTEDVCVLAEADLAGPEERAALAVAIRQAIAKNSDVTARFVELYDVGTLIKTSSGKIARSANRAKYLDGVDLGR